MTGPDTSSSIVVTQRERFGTSVESLENLLASIPAGTRVIVVDAGSPAAVARELARAAAAHDVLLLRTDGYLAPNEARNLALPYIDTDFAAFVDNDLLFEAGWLEQLSGCATDTGALLVSPATFQQGAYGLVTHMFGGACGIVEDEGRRRFREEHAGLGRPVEDIPELQRRRTGFIEFHCTLVSRQALETCFPLDEGLLSIRDHCDLTLQVQSRGGEIWLEPAAVVTQMLLPDRLPANDRRYYALRWSDVWNRASLARFREKWDLDPTDPLEAHDLVWTSVHRLYGNRSYGGVAGTLPSRPRRVAIRIADRAVQTAITVRNRTRHRSVAPPSIVHAPGWVRRAERLQSG